MILSVMMQSPHDIDWFAKIGDIYVHAMSFGGFIPRKVDILGGNVILLYEAYRLEESQDDAVVMDDYVEKRLHNQYELQGVATEEEQTGIRERYLRHFLEMARRGFYSFDRDVNDLMKYHLICKPTKPLAEWQDEIIPEISTSSLVETENTMMLVFGRHKVAER